jgi:hypothetical protein
MGAYNYFDDPDEFQSQQGSLIDRLMAGQGLQLFNQPGPASAGFPSSPMNANASAPAPQQPQNAPIAVGNVMMPRIGSGFNQDTAPAAPAAPATPAATPSPLDVIGNHLNAAAQSFGHGGGLIGGTAALITGQRHDPQNEALQLQQAQSQKHLDALVAAGVPPKLAELSIRDPEAAKAIIPQYVGRDKTKFVQLKDGLGGDHPAFVNEDAQTINGQPIADYNKQNNTNVTAGLGDMSKTGKDYLATIPAQQRGTVQAMIEGRMSPPNNMALSKPYWQNMIAAAQAADPSFDATQWSGRVAGVKDFSSGKSSEMVRSANQTLGHLSTLIDKMDNLKNGSYPSINYIENAASSATGGAAVTGFNQAANAVADELSKVYKGAGISDAEIKAWKDNLSPNASPAQQREAVSTASELLHHALNALEEKRVSSIGPMAAEKAGPLLKPDAQAALEKIQKWSAGPAKPAPGKTSTGVQWSVVQ